MTIEKAQEIFSAYGAETLKIGADMLLVRDAYEDFFHVWHDAIITLLNDGSVRVVEHDTSYTMGSLAQYIGY